MKFRRDRSSRWDVKGCKKISESDSVNVKCNCDHTTNFAVLMQVTPSKVNLHLTYCFHLVSTIIIIISLEYL